MNTKPEILKNAIKEEYIKCLRNISYFIKKYCLIQHPTNSKGKINFELYPFQENVLASFLKYNRIILLKNRQMGLSTLSAAYALWLMTFFNDKNILVIATKQLVAKNLISKIRLMHKNLPSWLRRKCVEDNKLGLTYDNGSKVFASTSASDSGRSEAVSLLIIDEAAFIPDMEELWASLQPTLSTGGQVIIISTPNGIGNWYHKTFVDAESNKNGFFPITLHWKMHPERDENWRKQQDLELGPRLAKQECDGTFLTSGETVVEGEILAWYKQNLIKEPIEKTGFDRNVWIWKFPEPNKYYILSADVARGDGKDYSVFQILEMDSLEQVAEYQGKISTRQFADLCIEFATKYNDALLVVENASYGWDVIQRIIDRNYSNLYYSEIDANEFIDNKLIYEYVSKSTKFSKRSVPGFTTSNKSRPLIISRMESYLREKSVIINSNRLINELFTFIWKNGRAESANNYNDDLVIAYAIGIWVRDTSIKLNNRAIDITKNSLISIKVNSNYNNNYNNKNDYIIDIGNGEKWDIRELFMK